LSKPSTHKPAAYKSAEAAINEPGILGISFLTPARLKRLIKFGLVGVSGVVVNLLIFEALFRLLAAPFSLANAVGIAVSVFTNFLLNDAWTWGDRHKGARRRDWLARVSKYYVSASAAAGVQLAVAWAANEFIFGHIRIDVPTGLGLESFDIGPRLAVLTGIVIGMAINLLASHLWAFRDVEAAS
jgi:dolichol-phosphate mannosyltransferase